LEFNVPFQNKYGYIRDERTMIITQPPAKIKDLSSHYCQPPRVAFAFLLTPDRPPAILSALLCSVQRSSLTIPRSLASCVPAVEHWCGQPCVWTAIWQCWGAGGTLIIEQPSIRPAGGRLIIVYHCLHRPRYLAWTTS